MNTSERFGEGRRRAPSALRLFERTSHDGVAVDHHPAASGEDLLYLHGITVQQYHICGAAHRKTTPMMELQNTSWVCPMWTLTMPALPLSIPPMRAAEASFASSWRVGWEER